MEGTELLVRIKETVPRMHKIIITGYPTVHNAIEAVNRNADAYLVKAFDVSKALFVIREQLKKQEAERRYNQEKVTEFIETQVRQLEVETVIDRCK
jgi:DNA-binding NtrC family response regulator